MFRRLVYLLLLTPILFNGCFEAPELAPEPVIKLKSVYFKTSNGLQDSLIVELEFQDGDGDLGLLSYDTFPPFHEMDSVIKFDRTGYIKIEDKELQEYDTLPAYPCENGDSRYWEYTVGKSNDILYETVFYVNRNPHHTNYHLDLLIDNGNGFEVYDFRDERCTSGLSGRFFPLNTSGIERPLEGTLRYGVQAAFKLLIPTQRVKVRVSIEDRNLNISNVVESDPLLLSDFVPI